MFQDGKGTGAGRDPCIGAQHCEIGLPAIERRERPGTIGVGHDLEAQPRRVGLEYGGKLGGETGLKAVGVPDGEDQRFGILQPDAAAPNRRNRQNQCQRGKQQHLSAIAPDDPRPRGWSFRRGRWDFSAHGTCPDSGAAPPNRLRGSPERDRKYLKKNDNFPVLTMISAPGRIANRAVR